MNLKKIRATARYYFKESTPGIYNVYFLWVIMAGYTGTVLTRGAYIYLSTNSIEQMANELSSGIIVSSFITALCFGATYFTLFVMRERTGQRYARLRDGLLFVLRIENLIKFFFLYLWKSFLVYLGNLFFYIPGIILGYSYDFADLIIADSYRDQEVLGNGQGLKQSRLMLKGYKWKLFLLKLPYRLLTIVFNTLYGTSSILLLMVYGDHLFGAVMVTILTILFSLAVSGVMIRENIARIIFYDELKKIKAAQ